MTWWQVFACWVLEWAERFYLHAHGWRRESLLQPGEYIPPDNYPFRVKHPTYVRSHAVNAQKQATYNPAHGGPRHDPDLPPRSLKGSNSK